MPTNRIQHLLINLPPAFSTQPELRELFARLERLAELRWTNHATLDALLPDLEWADAVFMWGAPKITESALGAAQPEVRWSAQYLPRNCQCLPLQRGGAVRSAPLLVSSGGRDGAGTDPERAAKDQRLSHGDAAGHRKVGAEFSG
jgi:hypothetical protein